MCHSRSAIHFRAVLVLALIGVASSMGALANRVFVSARSGNDANTCDNILAPCQTFAGAVTQLNPGGEAIVLDSGGYGPVTITTSVTIEAPPGVTAFIHPPSGNAITISAGAGDKVVLRGLVLNGGSGSGIISTSVGTLHIENCVVSGFANQGIQINAVGSNTFVKDTISRQNGGVGIVFSTGRASIDHCRFEDNGFDGVYLHNADVTIRESVSAGNPDHGFLARSFFSEGTVLNVYQCVATNNGAGVTAMAESGGATFTIARVADSAISENLTSGLNNGGGPTTFESLGNNFVRGNIGGDTLGTITVVLPK